MQKQSSLSSNIGCLLVIFSVFAALGAIGWMQYDTWHRRQEDEARQEADRSAQRLRDQENRAKLALREWPPIPHDPPPPLGTLPSVPDIGAATRFDVPPERVGDRSWQMSEMVMRRLKFMVSQMPDKTDRDLIESETVTLVVMDLGGSSRGGWDAVFTDTGEEDGHRPVILVDVEGVLFPPQSAEMIATAEEVLDFDTALAHELVHYRQWLSRPASERRIFEIRAFDRGDTVPPELCAEKWRLEREGYETTCRDGYAWGVSKPRNLAFCDRVNTPAAFDQGLFQALTSSAEGKKGIGTSCAATFARLAGHPHPEAFEP